MYGYSTDSIDSIGSNYSGGSSLALATNYYVGTGFDAVIPRFNKSFTELLDEFKSEMPGLHKVEDSDGRIVGYHTDIMAAALLCVRMAYEDPKYQTELRPSFDASLADPYHIRVVLAHGADGLPLNKVTDAVEGSFALSNLRGGQNSPENQINSFLLRSKETSPEALAVYKLIADAHSRLRASSSSSSDGIEIELTPPPGAKWCPAAHIGVTSKYFIHFSNGWYEHDDNKMLSVGYFGHANAQSMNTGGMFMDVTKTFLLKPDGRVLPALDPEYKADRDYCLYDKDTIEKKAKEACAELQKLKAAGTTDEKAISSHMSLKCDHGFTKGIAPLSHFEFAFFDALHGFANETEYVSTMIDDYAFELQGMWDLRCRHAPLALHPPSPRVEGPSPRVEGRNGPALTVPARALPDATFLD